ncbi:hypothetical protein TPHA_0O01960 [Tetrapisispora phaffii CBS 4417]|uniref:Elongin-A n=1 Tax=Tetrapisispora phaffii (strain ATCC 24235 / CBS 4417 / NBRC 1672 / NRRL Y-8282 / UCD 70-5) TaxID=1071381 RepID=G8C1Y4_TETPH|nr:hypothetical protein TPHA_0O01960 [Tetrapisispora phaffii CBS 4417]CCE66162.1 hypothetical protein TPHA_0O01960 [Tetrapisispora phaffii CBS 4417]
MITSLQEVAELHLVRNHKLVEDTGNMPYRLLKRVLKQMKKDQLIRVEQKNVILIFDDNELWLNFLKQDFPTSIHDSFTTKKNNIINYYLDFIKKNDLKFYNNNSSYIEGILKMKVVKDLSSNKYLIPYRMLYLKYEIDEIRKAEESTERLRIQMREIQKKREEKQTIQVDHSFYINNKSSRKSNKNRYVNSARSHVFKTVLNGRTTIMNNFKNTDGSIPRNKNHRIAFGGQVGGTFNKPEYENDISEEHQSPIDKNESVPVSNKSDNLKRSFDSMSSPVKRRPGITNIFLNKTRTSDMSRSQVRKKFDLSSKEQTIHSKVTETKITSENSGSDPIMEMKFFSKRSPKYVSNNRPTLGTKKKSRIFSSNQQDFSSGPSADSSKVYIHVKPSTKHR